MVTPPLLLHDIARTVVVGPRDTGAQMHALALIARRCREIAVVSVVVLTPIDVAHRAMTRDWGSRAYALAKAEVLDGAVGVVLAPGWETCAHSLATVELADVLGVSMWEWITPTLELDLPPLLLRTTA